MSAVMSTLSMISGGRRAHRKLTSRKSGQFSDAGEERTRTRHDLKQQRSASLQTLEAGGGGGGGGVVDLESLEAKMASIEVSLAGRRRSAGARDVTRELDALRTALTDKDSLIQSLKKQLSASLSAGRLAAQAASGAGDGRLPREESTALSPEERRALEERAAIVNADLDARKNNIQELRKRLEKTHVTENIDTRIQQAELQYQLGREELELLTLGEQARALAHLIHHADTALHDTLYSMVRECGGQGSLVSAEARDGSWGAAPRGGGMLVDWAAEHSPLRVGDRLVEVNGTLVVCCRSTEELSRALSGGGGGAPARLVVLRARLADTQRTFTQQEGASLRAELGALKSSAEDAERAKECLRADNTRLTHRISYLEEQVAELLLRHNQLQPVSSSDSCITVNKTKKNVTNINIGSEGGPCRAGGRSELQVFQKGPDITALVANLPGLEHEASLPLLRPRSNASGASSRAAASPRASPPPPPAPAGRVRPSLSHHCVRGPDYGAETDAAIRMIERNQRHIENRRLRSSRSRDERCRSDSEPESQDARSSAAAYEPRHADIKKAADKIEESIKKTNWAERKTLSIIEQLKRSQRLRKTKKNESAEDVRLDSETHYTMYRRIDGKVLENAHKSSRRTSKSHSRSAKSSELESECSDFPYGEVYGDCGSESCSTRLGHYRKHEERREGEGKSRPTPPRKPLRLSLHKARSAHSLLDGGESEPAGVGEDAGGKRPVKRTHGAGARDGARATPRPHRKLTGLAAPHADALYPDTRAHHGHVRAHTHARNWC